MSLPVLVVYFFIMAFRLASARTIERNEMDFAILTYIMHFPVVYPRAFLFIQKQFIICLRVGDWVFNCLDFCLSRYFRHTKQVRAFLLEW